MGHPLFVGVDVGTQGARALVCDEDGTLVAEASAPFEHPLHAPRPGWHEQDPDDWWAAATHCIVEVTGQAARARHPREAIAHVAVTSTSGSILLVDAHGRPLRPAIMYNDVRAADEAAEINRLASGLIAKLGYRFSASFALPKMLWLLRHEPTPFHDAAHICHPADFLGGRLTGRYDLSDTSNVLKAGFDLVDRRWPDFIEPRLGIPLAKLPAVVSPGQPVGRVSRVMADLLGLSPTALVLAGATDGTSAFLASGACQLGQWCSTLGTTFVLRGVSRELLRDPLGRIYCHAHPEGHWLPGAAYSVGGECLDVHFAGRDLAALDAQVDANLPNDLLIYPLARSGERFPFVDPDAEGFVQGKPESEAQLYAAYLEAVGFVERWGLDIMAELGAPIDSPIFASGGAAASDVWLQLRADILNRPLRVATDAHSAKGAALLAATPHFGALSTAIAHMVRFEKTLAPRPALRSYLDDKYSRFRETCAQVYPAAAAG